MYFQQRRECLRVAAFQNWLTVGIKACEEREPIKHPPDQRAGGARDGDVGGDELMTRAGTVDIVVVVTTSALTVAHTGVQ